MTGKQPLAVVRTTLLSAALLFAVPAHADGPWHAAENCTTLEEASKLFEFTEIASLRSEIERRYQHARDVAGDDSTQYSTSPLFTWASNAKISCAKALGYLKHHWVYPPVLSEPSLARCDCLYRRMQFYLR